MTDMNSNENEKEDSKSRPLRRGPKVKIVTTPLKPIDQQSSSSKFRDINEDDDGYHPYCDGPDSGIDYEEDPWI